MTRDVLQRLRDGAEIISVCAWCGKVRIDDQWVEVDKTDWPDDVVLSHGLCPVCAATEMDKGTT
jgi:hypothetical protein